MFTGERHLQGNRGFLGLCGVSDSRGFWLFDYKKTLYRKGKEMMKKVICTMVSVALAGLFLFFAVASGSDAETSSGGTQGAEETQTAAAAKMPTYGLGEVVTVKTSAGEYHVKITKVEETSDRNQFSDTQANRVVLISYEYENVSYQNDLSVSSMDMKVYDKENNLLETYPASGTKYGSSVGTGRKSNGIDAYALNYDENYLEIEFYDNMFNSSADCKFILEW